MTAQKLRSLQHAAERNQARARAANAARDEAVKRAVQFEGWSQAKIAETTGLTRGRIHQIVKLSSGGLS